MAITLTEVRTRSTKLVADRNAPRNARLFTRHALDEWGLAHLADDACAGVSELSAWMTAPGDGAVQQVALIWDGPLLFTEVSDAGAVPLCAADPAGGALAAALLETVAVEWGAEYTGEGWCLWASFATGRGESW